jgi:hypothetical protein
MRGRLYEKPFEAGACRKLTLTAACPFLMVMSLSKTSRNVLRDSDHVAGLRESRRASTLRAAAAIQLYLGAAYAGALLLLHWAISCAALTSNASPVEPWRAFLRRSSPG